MAEVERAKPVSIENQATDASSEIKAKTPKPAGRTPSFSNPQLAAIVGVCVLALLAAYWVGTTIGQQGPVIVSQAPDGSQVEVLTAQVAEMQRSEDRILTTILAVLGIAGTVLVAFVAIAQYASGQQYQRDKEAMERTIKADTKDQIGQAREDEAAARTIFEARIVEATGATLNPINDSIKSLRDDMRETRDALLAVRADMSQKTFAIFRAQGEIAATQSKWNTAFFNYSMCIQYGQDMTSDSVAALDVARETEIVTNATHAKMEIDAQCLDQTTEYLQGLRAIPRWQSQLWLVDALTKAIDRYRTQQEINRSDGTAIKEPF